jgi:phage-related protein
MISLYSYKAKGVKEMFRVIIYEDRNGKSPVADYIGELDKAALTDKSCRIRLGKILRYITLLEEYGTRAGLPASRYIEDDIWELRPLNDRLFYAYWKDNVFVILHHFTKKTQKTPRAEIEQAKRNLKDFLERSE